MGLLGFSRREARYFSAGKDGYFVSEGFSQQLPQATAGHKRLTRLQQGLSGASLVSFPYPVPKTAHRAARGRVWFWPAGWRLSGGLSSLSAIPCKKSSRRKNTPACFSKIEPVKFAIPCKRFSKPPGENPFSLFSGADFALPQSDPRTYAPRYFRTQTANPACPGPGSYHLNLWRGRLTPPCLAPICTPQPRGWAVSCTGAHRFLLCRLSLGRWFSPCR